MSRYVYKDEEPTWMTPAEVAEIFHVHPKTVTRWDWPVGSCIKTPGGHWRYRRAWIKGFIALQDRPFPRPMEDRGIDA